MKRTIASVILMALTMLSVASVMMQPVKAEIIVFTAQLLASNEVPPITNADRNAFGSVIVTLDTVANTARFDFSVENVASPAIILAHIHEGAAGVIGPVRVDSGLSPASPLTVVSGSASFSRGGLAVPTDVRDRLIANPAGFYFNAHSTLNPGGVVRGQLVRSAAITPGTSAPTLSEWGLILMTLLFIAVGTFFLVGRGKAATAAGAAEASVMFAGPVKAIDWKLLAQVALCVEAVVALGLIVFAAGAVDVLGALTSGLVIAFILHLFIGGARSR
jgi:cbb3-type cytochrome oxidase subunit 3